MSPWCEFGNVDSDREIVIHLGNILSVVEHPDDIDFVWLGQRLGMVPDEIWAALDLSNNEGFVAALYAAKAEEWGYEINDPAHVGGSFDLPFMADAPKAPKIAMPRAPIQVEALLWLEDGHNSQPDNFYFWPLPAADLWLPKPMAAMTYMPAIDAYQGAHRRKCISVGVGEPHVDTGTLHGAARKLRKAIEAREEKARESLGRIVLIQKMIWVVDLQIRHWKHPWTRISDEEKAERVVRMRKLRDVEKALLELLEAVVGRPEAFPAEDAAADELLALLAPSGAIGPQLRTFFDELEHRSTVVSAGALEGVVDTLTEVFELLARSSRAEVFLRDHLLEILEQTCKHPPPGFDAMVAELSDESLQYQLTDGWRDFFVEARRAVGTGPTSPLVTVGSLCSVYRSLLRIAGAALNDVLVARLLFALDRVRVRDAVTLGQKVMRPMAGFLFRYLANHGWQHRGLDGTIVFGKNLAYSEVLREMTLLGYEENPDWLAAGRRLNRKLEIKRGFLRTHGGVSIAILVSFATFLYAADNDTKGLHLRTLDMAAGLAGIGASVAKGLEIAALRAVTEDPKLTLAAGKKLSERAGQLGALAAAYGMISSVVAGVDEFRRGNAYGTWTHGIGAAASLMSIAAWRCATSYVFLSLYATGVGLALGAVAFALVLLEGELRDGPEYLIDAYWRNVDHPDSPARRFPGEVNAVTRAIEAAFLVDAFDDFHLRVGSPRDDLSPDDPPTLHAAHALGFEQQEIAALFNVRSSVVREQAGIEAVDYEEVLQ